MKLKLNNENINTPNIHFLALSPSIYSVFIYILPVVLYRKISIPTGAKKNQKRDIVSHIKDSRLKLSKENAKPGRMKSAKSILDFIFCSPCVEV